MSLGKIVAVFLVGTLVLCGIVSCSKKSAGTSNELTPESDGAYHVYEGGDIQAAIEAAAADPKNKVVKVHEGTYFPSKPGQAFIWLNRKHDGVRMQAVGKVILTAENAKKAIVTSRSYPAIVNHVVYLGNGLTSKTVIDGFEITGANGRMGQDGVEIIEPEMPESLQTTLFFFSDGGAVKVFGDSSPQLLNLKVYKNEVRICGAGISVDQHGLCENPVLIRNCQFFDNKCPATGSAIDVLQDSKAKIENCLFTRNIGNYGMAEIAKSFGLSYNSKHGCGALTVFPKSTATVSRCTFTQNWNGVDDKGINSRYENCIFWKNDKSDGSRTGQPYELDVNDSSEVIGCYINGVINDLQNQIDPQKNFIEKTDPNFDEQFIPQSKKFQKVGYRPK